jgi:hypothetical protein
MEPSGEQPDIHSNVAGWDWRRLWKGVCIGNVGFAVGLWIISGALLSYRQSAQPSPLFLLLDGLLALAELLCLVMAGIADLGWIICRSRGDSRKSQLNR